MKQPTIKEIDAVLPQTQCGDCGYGGCIPYAKAMAEGKADINLCLPGGTRVLKKLADLFHKDAAKFTVAAKPYTVAVIDEATCIGCTKCIQACPVDAISGAAKLMHTIIASECTGCGLCVAPCPVDCISLQPINDDFSDDILQAKATHARQRFDFRNQRVIRLEQEEQQRHTQAKKLAIAAALARVKSKRSPDDPTKTP